MPEISKVTVNGVTYDLKDTTARTQSGTGTPEIVDLVADMVDTTIPYLYVGNETGYNKGDWYYYNGSAWVSGGTYGTDGGVNTNARNILKYILQRVAYTEQGMEVYVQALYQALAQAGGGGGGTVTTYSIINALVHVTNSNDATGIDEGDSYSATLTADTDYRIDSVTVTMGGVDITSTAYDSSDDSISIASVTGDIVITATATDAPVLPSEYQKVEYIAGTGTQYIDSGVTLTNGSVRMKAKLMATATNAYNMQPVTVRSGSNAGQLGVNLYAIKDLTHAGMSSGNGTNSFGGATTYNVVSSIKNALVEIDATLSAGNSAEATITGGGTIDGVPYTKNPTTGTSFNNTISTVGIFGNNKAANANSVFKGRIYSVQIWNEGNMVINAVPCYRISDGVIGMYDFVSEAFWTNAGSGTFTKGSDV